MEAWTKTKLQRTSTQTDLGYLFIPSMLFEGSIFSRKNSFNVENVRPKYSEVVFSDYGFIGVKGQTTSESLTNSFLGGFFSDSKIPETEFLSNCSAEKSVSFFLSILDEKVASADIGVSAFFDVERKELLLSRDLFGRVPLYYAQVDNAMLVFSTSFASLCSNADVRRSGKADIHKVADYGTFLTDAEILYHGDTFLSNIKSVLPGHLLRLTFHDATITPLLVLQPSKWAHLTSLQEFGEEFRSQFLNAVEYSDKGPNQRLASHLSGGMDSSSVSTAVRFLFPDHPLVTLYNKTNTLNSDENLFASAVADAIGSEHYEIMQSEEDLQILRESILSSRQPSCAILSPSANWSLMKVAKSHGCDTIFNGRDGDSIVGSGLEIIDRSFTSGDWDLVKTLLEKRVAYYSLAGNYPRWNRYSFEQKYNIVLQKFLYRQLSRKVFQVSFKEFGRFFAEVSRHFKVSYSYHFRSGLQSLLNKTRKKESGQITSVLCDDILLQRKERTAFTPIGLLGDEEGQKLHRQSLLDVFNSHAILANEQDFVLSNHLGVVSSSPFYNRGLFELCMAVPDIVKYGDGIGRAHFREGMKGLLIDKVRCRSTKTPIRSHGQEVTLRMYEQAKDFLFDSKAVWEYVDRKKFAHQISVLTNAKIPYGQKISTWFHISKTISLAIWLEALSESE